MPRFRFPRPIPIPIPIPVPTPNIHIGGTLGDIINSTTEAFSNVGDRLGYKNEYFEKLNDEAKNLITEFEEKVLELAGVSNEELVAMLIKRVSPKLNSNMNIDDFNNLFKEEACALFREQYGPDKATCLFIVAGLMIAAAVAIIILQPALTLFTQSLISGAFALAATGCAAL
ncbi:hypothetical protein P8859_07990 [Bacillus spizizenii]|nr:hypothetical protein [Bacillus spizizenii]MCY8311689.1 hypothetical protein [Bacillus spizizenii]MCY9332643.1 hypothetical protein [Bacillus spizizenii]MEC0620513.1 hypothetical protein [Bacillus spizizenii]MEC0641770.1 hypothetical protein [Bacillus spizizenii]